MFSRGALAGVQEVDRPAIPGEQPGEGRGMSTMLRYVVPAAAAGAVVLWHSVWARRRRLQRDVLYRKLLGASQDGGLVALWDTKRHTYAEGWTQRSIAQNIARGFAGTVAAEPEWGVCVYVCVLMREGWLIVYRDKHKRQTQHTYMCRPALDPRAATGRPRGPRGRALGDLDLLHAFWAGL